MISWEEELLARLASEPIQEIVIVVRIEIVLDGVAEADGDIRILRNIKVFVQSVRFLKDENFVVLVVNKHIVKFKINYINYTNIQILCV